MYVFMHTYMCPFAGSVMCRYWISWGIRNHSVRGVFGTLIQVSDLHYIPGKHVYMYMYNVYIREHIIELRTKKQLLDTTMCGWEVTWTSKYASACKARGSRWNFDLYMFKVLNVKVHVHVHVYMYMLSLISPPSPLYLSAGGHHSRVSSWVSDMWGEGIGQNIWPPNLHLLSLWWWLWPSKINKHTRYMCVHILYMYTWKYIVLSTCTCVYTWEPFMSVYEKSCLCVWVLM